MNNDYILIADALAKKGIELKFKHNSTLGFINNGYSSPEVIRSLAGKLADKINTNVTYVHGTLMPIYRDCVKYVKEVYEKYKPGYDYAQWSIREISPDDFTLELANKVKNTNKINTTGSVPAEFLDVQLTFQELCGQYLTYGTGEENTKLQTVVTRLGEEKIVEIWNNILCNFTLDNSKTQYILNNPLEYADELTIVYVILDNFRQNKPTFVRSPNFAEYIDNCLKTIEVAFNLLTIQVEGLKNTKRVILGTTDKVIKVYKPLYDEYLNNGGTPDAILAAGKNFDGTNIDTLMLSSIESNSVTLKEEWRNFVTISKHKIGIREAELYRNAYNILITNMFKEIIPNNVQDDHAVCCNSKHASLAYDKVMEECSTDTKMISNVEKVVGKLLSYVFEDTDLGYFIRTIKHYGEKYDIEPNEAAGLAVVDYITYYLLNQIED